MSGSSSLSALEALTAHTIIERVQVLLEKVKKEEHGLSPDGRKALEEATAVAAGLDPYLEQVSTPHPDILNDMLKKTNETDWKALYERKQTQIPLIKEMSAGGFEAVVLREFARMTKAKRILEIGVFTSTTTVALALLPQVEKIVALDIEPYLVEFAEPFYKKAQVEDKIDFRIGDAIKTLEDLEAAGETFDMVFIDADKGGYANYYEKIISSKTLLAPDGLIVADNTVYKASVFVHHEAFAEGAKALGEFNKKKAMMELSYLVMTAADAADWNECHPHDIISLNQLLETRARDYPDTVCVGFVTEDQGRIGYDTLTFARLFELVCLTAHALTKHEASLHARASDREDQETVALLAPSCKDFLVHLFAFLRLGYRVLLVAPQNTPDDVAKLCQAVGARHLVFAPSMSKAARPAGEKGELQLVPMLPEQRVHDTGDMATATLVRSALSPQQERTTDCVVFHSSGSSGTPKPIPQKHKVWTEAACCKPHSPSFTTTPLFHGGISDLFRSMMSKSTLYMFPSTIAITTSRLVSAFPAFDPPATSFLSVPYILEQLAHSKDGLETLTKLELVSTGGSPMPESVGDLLCESGVNLVSRYGSILMSSFRPFETDRGWSFLRTSETSERWLRFEDQGDGSFELIVPANWPTRSKSNCDDGSYATSDLFVRHPSIPHAWRLTGRADDVILMSNGEKSSPAPLEAMIAASDHVKEALVFGSNRSALGVAIVPSSEGVTLEQVRPIIVEANRIAPSHSQISPELVVLLSSTSSFPKASKGTLQRGRAYETFADEIEQAYRKFESEPATNGSASHALTGATLRDAIRQLVLNTLNASVRDDEDLFNAGLNSLQAVRIRNALQRQIKTPSGATLSMNAVFECGNMEKLAQHIEALQGGESGIDTDLDLMRQLTSSDASLMTFTQELKVITEHTTIAATVLTGATGSLGAQLVPQILMDPTWPVLISLVRADDDRQARERVLANLESNKITLGLDELAKLRCHASRLDEPQLGLAQDVYQELSTSNLRIIHAAWPVHFGAGLSSFVPHLQGLRHLIDLAAGMPASLLYFCSSTAAVLGRSSDLVREEVSTDPEDVVAMGYARSKHVAETLCAAAFRTVLPGRLGILRLGQLSADTENGVWKGVEGWPLLVASSQCAGCLPDLDETLSWLPTDKAAEAILDITSTSGPSETVPVFHVVSTHHSTTYRDMLEMLRASGLSFDVVSRREWLDRLRAEREKGSTHPSLKMLDVWIRNYGGEQAPTSDIRFETSRAGAQTIALDEPLSVELMSRAVQYWRETGLLK